MLYKRQFCVAFFYPPYSTRFYISVAANFLQICLCPVLYVFHSSEVVNLKAKQHGLVCCMEPGIDPNVSEKACDLSDEFESELT
jgi:hypothetical protein